jgi:hypothetical protein
MPRLRNTKVRTDWSASLQPGTRWNARWKRTMLAVAGRYSASWSSRSQDEQTATRLTGEGKYVSKNSWARP